MSQVLIKRKGFHILLLELLFPGVILSERAAATPRPAGQEDI